MSGSSMTQKVYFFLKKVHFGRVNLQTKLLKAFKEEAQMTFVLLVRRIKDEKVPRRCSIGKFLFAAFFKPKGILTYSKRPNGVVTVVLLTSSGWTGIW